MKIWYKRLRWFVQSQCAFASVLIKTMNMYLQIFLFGVLVVLVNSQLQPQHLASSYLRRRRNAPNLPQQKQNYQNEYDDVMRYRKQLYDLENEHLYKSTENSYTPNESEGDDKMVAKRFAQPHFPEEEEHYAPPKYNFKYTVHDVEHHDVKHHQEERDGDNTVGEYSVLQPDGTVLTVRYSVHGDEGFNAVVSKSEYEHHYDH